MIRMTISAGKIYIRLAATCMAFILLFLCTDANAAGGHSHLQRVLKIDTVNDAKAGRSFRIQYTDIIVHITDSGWVQKDSALFYSEHTKVEWASKILLDQISREKDSLSHFVDSAGARVGRGAITKEQVDSVVSKMDTDIQQKISTQEYALKRLEDYRHVSEAVDKILKRKDNE